MAGGEEIIGAAAHQFATEVLVELTCHDEDEDLVVYSYAFSFNGDDTVHPEEAVPDRHREHVATALSESGFELHAGSLA